jgi:hypothetical protein
MEPNEPISFASAIHSSFVTACFIDIDGNAKNLHGMGIRAGKDQWRPVVLEVALSKNRVSPMPQRASLCQRLRKKQRLRRCRSILRQRQSLKPRQNVNY